MDRKQNNWKILFLIIVIFSTIVPAIFGKPNTIDDTNKIIEFGDPWRTFIFNFQSLIGGFLAIIAALWTVSEMQKSEKNQEYRHIENLKNSNLPINNLYERLFYHSLPELYFSYYDLNWISNEIQLKNQSEEEIKRMVFEIFPLLKLTLQRIDSTFDASIFDRLDENLPNEVDASRKTIKGLCESIIFDMEVVLRKVGKENIEYNIFQLAESLLSKEDFFFYETYENILNSMSDIINEINSFSSYLRNIALKMGIPREKIISWEEGLGVHPDADENRW